MLMICISIYKTYQNKKSFYKIKYVNSQRPALTFILHFYDREYNCELQLNNIRDHKNNFIIFTNRLKLQKSLF